MAVVLLPSILTVVGGQAQTCTLSIQGQVIDQHTGEPMPFVTLFERSLGRGVTTDFDGQFKMGDLCAGEMHLELDHLGCETVELFIHLTADTTFDVRMHHNAQLLGEVDIIGHQTDLIHLGAEAISRSEIDARSDEDLTAMLTQITGLSAVQNGSAIAKPVYHGMSGNRLTILNNGIAQSGQQWGSDHAPEIDAFAADRLTVIQGVNTLAQNGPDLGGMILVEMQPIANDPHVHGKVNYTFMTNGAGHALSSRMEKTGDWAAWRTTLTAKMIGDRQSPDYFLTNTANRQLNASLLVEKEIAAHWQSSLYLSTFNSEIGLLRGSHIGNLSDLSEAFSREVPFFTEDALDYTIDDPRQAVSHHLLKFENTIRSSLGIIDLTYAGQFNARREFDVRRGGRSDQAALDIDQSDHLLESSIKIRPDSALSWRAGLQYRSRRNTNDPQTGVLPLVPDYLSQTGSAFLLSKWKLQRWQLAAGTRVDIKNIYALTISRTLPREIVRQDLWYSNPSAVLTMRYEPIEELEFEGEAAYRERSPEVNELYSNGLHQGVSGIEEGDEQLENESGQLIRISSSYHIKEKYFITVSAYQHQIDDFIYLRPQEEFRLTIRGAFPVFKYEQVDARLLGLDLTFAAEIGSRWRLRSSYSVINGQERKSGLGLIGIPANNGTVDIHYESGPWKGFKNIQLGASYSHTAMRSDLLTDNQSFPDRQEDNPLMGQDFIAPPPAYSLVAIDIHLKRQIGKSAFDLGLKVDNLFDVRYRDYLDRQRYFADAMGRNVKVRVGWDF